MVRNKRKQRQSEKNDMAAVILSHITKHPGVHFKDLLRALKLAPGTLQYHLNQLEENEGILVMRKEYYTSYFPPTMKDPKDQKIMVLLRQNIPRKLILILLEQSDKTGSKLAKSLKITKSTLSYYTKRLVNIEVLNMTVVGREKKFSVNDPRRISRLLKEFKKSFADELVDRFVELWVRI